MIELILTTSTNDEAKKLVQAGQASDGLVVWAKEQTQGRGRRGRVWISPPGNLHCSVLFDISHRRADAAQLGFVAAIALVETLRSVMPTPNFYAKWPNDVLAGDSKVAGMLLEAEAANWLVLGLGVDVAHAPPADAVERPATSLTACGYDGDVRSVLDGFYARLMPLVQRWRQEGFAAIRQAWLEMAYGRGGPIVVRLEAETIEGTFDDLDRDGALVMTDRSGQKRRILAGDVYMGGLGASGH